MVVCTAAAGMLASDPHAGICALCACHYLQGVELSGEGGILAKFAGAGYQQVSVKASSVV